MGDLSFPARATCIRRSVAQNQRICTRRFTLDAYVGHGYDFRASRTICEENYDGDDKEFQAEIVGLWFDVGAGGGERRLDGYAGAIMSARK